VGTSQVHIVRGLALSLLCSLAQAQKACPAADATARDRSVNLVCQALDAVNDLDARRLGELMAEDFSLTTISGKYFGESKAEMVRRWTQAPEPGTKATSRLTKVFRIRVAGASAFVSGEIEDKTIRDGQGKCESHAFTDLWERRQGRWLWVHSHESGHRDSPCQP